MKSKSQTEAMAENAASEDPMVYIARGRRLVEQRRQGEAEACFVRALELDPTLPMAHNNLGWLRETAGDRTGAVACYERALQLNPHFTLAQYNLATLLTKLDQNEAAQRNWAALADRHPGDARLLGKLIDAAIRAGDLETAASRADEYALLGETPGRTGSMPVVYLTVPKLRHDLEQFAYLRSRNILSDKMSLLIDRHEKILNRALAANRGADRWKMDDTERAEIGEHHNRLHHRAAAPRLPQAFSGTWAGPEVEDQYLNHPSGLAVIDNFLSEDALQTLRRFCLESTFWFANHYAHGRLGAMFRHGFNCPLLIQIAQELAAAFPTMIGETHRLRQIWAYKYGYSQPPTSAHADFAAVNVNFWLTADEANLYPMSGGLVVYDIEAPMNWDFDSYNRKGDKIGAFLRDNDAGTTTIPYRANRAVIFNSDLFHATQEFSFSPGYENRRINVTLLFGLRENASSAAQRRGTGALT